MSTTNLVTKRLNLKELSIPDLETDIREYCARHGVRNSRAREAIAQDIKLQYLYGGQDVAYLATDKGIVVVAAGRRDAEEFRHALASLNPDERRRVVHYSPRPWNDEANSAPTSFTP